MACFKVLFHMFRTEVICPQGSEMFYVSVDQTLLQGFSCGKCNIKTLDRQKCERVDKNVRSCTSLTSSHISLGGNKGQQM